MGAATVSGAVDLARFADDSAQFATRNSSETEQPACRRGCTSCCHLHVGALAPEAIAIATALRQALTAGGLGRLSERIDDHIARTNGTDASGRRGLRLPCPLLDEQGDCLAYHARPLSCRGWNSLDAALCEADLRDPSRDNPARLNLTQYVLVGRILEGLSAGSHALGRDHRRLDLVRALDILLKDDEAANRWLQGSDVFEGAANERVFPDPDDAKSIDARQKLWNSLGPGFVSES